MITTIKAGDSIDTCCEDCGSQMYMLVEVDLAGNQTYLSDQIFCEDCLPMNAEDARKLTKESLSGKVIEPYLNFIYNKISEAAKNGRSEIHHPFSGVQSKSLKFPTSEVREATYQRLRMDGFTIIHTNVNSSDPREVDYETISW